MNLVPFTAATTPTEFAGRCELEFDLRRYPHEVNQALMLEIARTIPSYRKKKQAAKIQFK